MRAAETGIAYVEVSHAMIIEHVHTLLRTSHCRIEPVTSRSLVQRPTYYATVLHLYLKTFKKLSERLDTLSSPYSHRLRQLSSM